MKNGWYCIRRGGYLRTLKHKSLKNTSITSETSKRANEQNEQNDLVENITKKYSTKES